MTDLNEHRTAVATHFPKLRRYVHSKVANAADAQDVAADAVRVFLEKAQTGETITDAKRYLFGIANNKLRQYWARRAPAGNFDSALHSVQQVSTTLGTKLDRSGQITAALQTLPMRQQQAIELRYGEGFKLEEIAEQLEVGLATVKRDIERGIEAMRVAAKLSGTPEDIGLAIGSGYRRG